MNHFSWRARAALDKQLQRNLFTDRCINSLFPEIAWHTFNSSTINVVQQCVDHLSRSHAPTTSFIIIHRNAHRSPPEELWTRWPVQQLSANVGRPMPVFWQSSSAQHLYDFIGCYRILKWNMSSSNQPEFKSFLETCIQWHPERSGGEEDSRDWARVQLERVVDPILSGKPQHRYVIRYALKILGRIPCSAGTD